MQRGIKRLLPERIRHIWPDKGLGSLVILSICVLGSALARGIDFLISPHDSSVTQAAISEWASPTALGWFLIVFSVLGLVSLFFKSKAARAMPHIVLSTLFLVMGLVSLFPVVLTVGWGWRAPISYILGSAVVHWYIATKWFEKWVSERGRSKLSA